MKKVATILLLCQDPERRADCQRALAGTDVQLCLTPEGLPEDGQPDIVVTDKPLEDTPWASAAGVARLAAGEIGVVRLGGEGSADVCLPTDVTARELRLTCALVAQIIRLRRELQRSRRLQQALQRLAYTDPLTALPNRRAWDEETAALANGAQAPTGAICLAILDLDHFKEINDRCGHAIGDSVLQHVAARLATRLPAGGFAARLGGDEFGLLLSSPNAAEARQAIEALRIAVCQGSPPAPVTASAGMAVTAERQALALTTLFDAASEALRQAKSAGRNQTWPSCVVQPG